jgi:hypothetical protein
MFDGLTVIWLVLGFGFLMAAGARLGAGSHLSLAGLFPAHGVRDWPVGVQEPDAPRFDVAHLDGLRPASRGETRSAVAVGIEEPQPEIVELYVRSLAAPHCGRAVQDRPARAVLPRGRR